MSLSIGLGIRIGSEIAGGGAVPVLLSPPTGFTLTPPFSVYRTGFAYSTSVNAAYLAALKPVYQTTIYVNSGGAFIDSGGASWGAGSNNNDGLSKAAPVRSMRLGVARLVTLTTANSYTDVRMVVAAGTYRLTATQARSGQPDNNATWADAWTGTSPTANLALEVIGAAANERVKNVIDQAFPSFVATSDPNIYVSTYTSPAPSRVVIDLLNLNARSRPVRLRPVLTVADAANPWPEINAQWTAYPGYGATYLDTTNKKTYVRLADNRAPDSSVLSLVSTTGIRMPTSASPVLWMQNFELWGGQTSPIPTSGAGVYVAVDSAYCYGPTNGFAWSGNFKGTVYQVRCTGTDNDADGLNYHGKVGGTNTSFDPDVYEIDCITEWNGWNGDGTNNGSTIHEYSRIVRVNGSYLNNADRSIHDINHSLSWNLGCTAGPSFNAAASPKANWVSGLSDGGNEVGTVWMDGCISVTGSTYDLYVYSTAALKYANMTIGNFVLGGTTANITAYTP